MLLRAFLRPVLLAAAVGALVVGVGPTGAAASGPDAQVVGLTSTDQPVDTANPFLPDDRSISDCVSALPKPGCGSEERGGWHQQLVFLALVGGLSVIGWRIVAGARKNARAAAARMQTGASQQPR